MGLRLRSPAATSDPTGHELGESVSNLTNRRKQLLETKVVRAGSEALNAI